MFCYARPAAAFAAFTLLAQPAEAARDTINPRDLPKNHAENAETKLESCVSAAVRASAPDPRTPANIGYFTQEGRRSVVVSGIDTLKSGLHKGAVVSYQLDQAGPMSLTVLYVQSDPLTQGQGPRDIWSKLEFNRASLGDAPHAEHKAGPKAKDADKIEIREKAFDVGLFIRTCVRAEGRENLGYPEPAFKVPSLRFENK